jgi:hypothetical protein
MIKKVLKGWIAKNIFDGFVNRENEPMIELNIGEDESIETNLYNDMGLLRLKNLFTQEQIDCWREEIRANLLSSSNKYSYSTNETHYYNAPVDVLPSALDIIANNKLVARVEELLGEERRFIGHDSVSYNFSQPGIHDDQNSYRNVYGYDYQGNVSEIRVLFNLNSWKTPAQLFGYVPGSHLRKMDKFDVHLAKRHIKWIEVSFGDVILFNPRLLHSADKLTNDKYMIVLTYDRESEKLKPIYDDLVTKRGQGTRPLSPLWNKLVQFNLSPSHLG